MLGRRQTGRAGLASLSLSLGSFFWFKRSAAPSLANETFTLAEYAQRRQLSGQPTLLDDLEQVTFAVDKVSILDMRPYHNEYWTAFLESEITPEAIIPIYQKVNDPSQAVFYCPSPGRYTLSIRIPVRSNRDGSRESDPPTCYPYSAGNYWDQFADVPAVQRMLELCLTTGPLDDFLDRQYAEGCFPPHILSYESSKVFQSTVTCISGNDTVDGTFRREQVQLLANSVYGNGTAVLSKNGLESLGYWQKDTIAGNKRGSLSYQPQPEHCPDTFAEPGLLNSHQERCGAQATAPTFRWTPYHTTRGLWALTPLEIKQCLKTPIRFYGDSIMRQHQRGISCLARGYAGMDTSQFPAFRDKEVALGLAALFPSREPQGRVTDEEVDRILRIDQLEDSKPTVEVWSVGMWLLGSVPTADWPRGIHRWLARVKARADTGTSRPIITLLTSPLSDPLFPLEVGWQTVNRAHYWNALVLAIAQEYSIPVVDTFWPTVHRHDARNDNAHSCGLSSLISSGI